MTSCAFFGYNDIGYEALKTLISLNQNIDVVFTHNDNQNENIWFKSVKQLAEKHNITTYTHTPTAQELIEKFDSDIVLSAYYRNIIPNQWLLHRPLGAYNIHGSLLPKYRGAQPTNWVVICGEKKSGITLHTMSEKIDAGNIFNQKEIIISNHDTAFEVMQKIIPLTKQILIESWFDIVNKIAVSKPQNENLATIFYRRTPNDGLINFNTSAKNIYNLIRGLSYPYPNAFFFLDKKKININKSNIQSYCNSVLTGSIINNGKYPIIKCKIDAIEIIEATTEDNQNAIPLLNTKLIVDKI